MICKVTRIIDGDTFEVSPNWKFEGQTGNVVRPRGHDAPEWGQPGYQEAKDKLASLILGKEVELKNPIGLTYDRLLCDVYYNGKRLIKYFYTTG
ncbi:MAG: thermonuclease family protein [Candidatus Omnitrophica bacterium]|nr:thermonuclease family protein [Candidatus Omnitrophota bacterium]